MLIFQMGLIILYYGGSTLGGIDWAALPWWLVWLPSLFAALVLLVAILWVFVLGQ